jgi:hypothetical protein
MAFKALFMAHVPDADPERDNCILETEKYKLYVRLVKGQNQALEVCRKLVKEEGIEAIMLCPASHTKTLQRFWR